MNGRLITELQSGVNAMIEISKVEFYSHDLRWFVVTTAEALDL